MTEREMEKERVYNIVHRTIIVKVSSSKTKFRPNTLYFSTGYFVIILLFYHIF